MTRMERAMARALGAESLRMPVDHAMAMLGYTATRPDTLPTVAQAVHQLRRSLGLKRSELAAALGVSHRSIAQWEQGGRIPNGPITARLLALAPTRAEAVALQAALGALVGPLGALEDS